MNEILKKAIENFKKKQDKRFLSLRSEINTRIDIKNEKLEEKTNENIVYLASKFGELIGRKVGTIKKQIITRHNDLEGLKWSKSGHIIDENINFQDKKIVNLEDPVDEKDAVNFRTVLRIIRQELSKFRPQQVFVGGGGNGGGGGSEIIKDYLIKTANYTLTSADEQKVIYMNSDSGELTATLPASPADKDVYIIKNVGSNDVIINRNGNNIERLSENQTLSKFSHPTAKLQYTNSLGWFLI